MEEKLNGKQQIKGFLGAIPVCALITLCLEVGLSFLHRTVSIQKHLIHFAILLLAAEGMVLLYGAVPSVRRIWARIDRRILSVETRKRWVDNTYSAIAILMTLHHFYVLLYYPKLPAGASRLAPVWIPFAMVTVFMGKLWRNKGFWLGSLLVAFLFERTCLKDPNLSGETMVYMVSALYALIICYGFFDVIRPENRRNVLRIMCALWTIGTLVLSGIGLYVTWTGGGVKNLGDAYAYIDTGRLDLFAVATTSGGILAGSAMFALVGFAAAKKTIWKVLYLIALIPMMIANAMTDTRSSLVMLSFALGGMVTLRIWGLMKKRVAVRGKMNIALAAGLAACMAGCTVLAVVGQQGLKNGFVEIRNRGSVIISSAMAEADEEENEQESNLPWTSSRDVVSGDKDQMKQMLSGRWDIWEGALRYAKEHPETLYYGLSPDGTVRTVTDPEPHCHNILVQVFMEGGIPGIGLFLGLMVYFCLCAIKLWKRWNLPLWQRLLPVPALAVLLMEMVECLTHFAYGHIPMTVLYFFIGATVAVSKSHKNNNDVPDSI